MTREEMQAALEGVKAAAHEQYGAHHTARLGQLDQALATASMAVGHLADEEEREVELAGRIISRAKVHGNDEVVSPVGRPHAETLRIHAGEN